MLPDMPSTVAPASLNTLYSSLNLHASFVHPGVDACKHTCALASRERIISLLDARTAARGVYAWLYLGVEKQHYAALATKLVQADRSAIMRLQLSVTQRESELERPRYEGLLHSHHTRPECNTSQCTICVIGL